MSVLEEEPKWIGKWMIFSLDFNNLMILAISKEKQWK